MGRIKGAIFCSFWGVTERAFCAESFNLSEMGYKLPNYADKLPMNRIYGALRNEEGLPTCS